MQFSRKKTLLALALVLLFAAGIGGGFFYFSKKSGRQPGESPSQADLPGQDLSSVRIYYPSEGKLITEERKIKRQTSLAAVAEAVTEEYLKGPSKTKSEIPRDAKLLSAYFGNDGILYLDLSDEFRRNFQGDALNEYFLLKGLYESIISNVGGADDVKVIVEGKEIESIGGHLLAVYPLKNMLAEIK